MTDRYISDNPYLREEDCITYHLVDNRKQNKAISAVYNEFLDSYDYSEDAWFVFMHSDFEFLSYPSNVLSGLDPKKIYGPAGAKVYIGNGKMYVATKGEVFEKDSDNTLYWNLNYRCSDLSVDTLDCMCMFVHSSLVRKYNLRFDESMLLDLYVEDFCISAKKKHEISTEALHFECAHHSSYTSRLYYSRRYLKQHEVINTKYPDDIFGGTVTAIGGRMLPLMTDNEFMMYRIRRELLTGRKI